ncbi:MAG: hypothetical protein P8R42_08815 [Candidatus Binatia bacterium]|nr:hypothetical protein [Candidatus Binatia bacterium]
MKKLTVGIIHGSLALAQSPSVSLAQADSSTGEGAAAGIAGFGMLFMLAFGVFLAVLAILMPLFVYQNQKFTRLCLLELKKVNAKLDAPPARE